MEYIECDSMNICLSLPAAIPSVAMQRGNEIEGYFVFDDPFAFDVARILLSVLCDGCLCAFIFME